MDGDKPTTGENEFQLEARGTYQTKKAKSAFNEDVIAIATTDQSIYLAELTCAEVCRRSISTWTACESREPGNPVELANSSRLLSAH